MMQQLCAAMLLGAVGCATTATTAATWPAAGSQDEIGHTGRVESVREIVQRVQGDPSAGALFGAVIGGLLSHGRALGVVSGAVIGAAASEGSAEYRSYEVGVRLDDGRYTTFLFRGDSPFTSGSAVVLTPHGPEPV